MDTVSLWHVFQLPWDHWRMLEEASWEQATDNYTEYCAAYAGKIGGLIKALRLPIGYQCVGLLLDLGDDGVLREVHLVPTPDCNVAPPPNPIRYNDDPLKARHRLVELLNVVDR